MEMITHFQEQYRVAMAKYRHITTMPILSIFIGCRRFTNSLLDPPEALSEFRKKYKVSSNLTFNNKKVSIHKKFINNIYVKLNCTSNYIKIILDFCKSKEWPLIKSGFFGFLKNY
jgi:hypothetical protein